MITIGEKGCWMGIRLPGFGTLDLKQFVAELKQ